MQKETWVEEREIKTSLHYNTPSSKTRLLVPPGPLSQAPPLLRSRPTGSTAVMVLVTRVLHSSYLPVSFLLSSLTLHTWAWGANKTETMIKNITYNCNLAHRALIPHLASLSNTELETFTSSFSSNFP